MIVRESCQNNEIPCGNTYARTDFLHTSSFHMKLDNLKIRTLLLAGFGTILTVMLLLVGLGIAQMNKADALTKKLSGESFRRASMLQEWQAIIDTNGARTLAALKLVDETDSKFFLDAISVASRCRCSPLFTMPPPSM